METTFRPPEIDNHTMKLIAGIIALALGPLTSVFARDITSISASYWAGGVAQIIFLGFLFATASFFLAYNGYSRMEMIASKSAAIAALGVALFPCGCDGHEVKIPYLHWISAATMFLILTYFCYVFFARARAKPSAQAKWRAAIYAVCGVAMVVSIAVLVYNGWTTGEPENTSSRLVFYGEAVALGAFGVSWLTASRMLPVITKEDERIPLLKPATPVESSRTEPQS